MLTTITPEQFDEWITYQYIEPLDRNTSLIANHVAMYQNVHRGHGQALTVDMLIGKRYHHVHFDTADKIEADLRAAIGF